MYDREYIYSVSTLYFAFSLLVTCSGSCSSCPRLEERDETLDCETERPLLHLLHQTFVSLSSSIIPASVE